VTEPDAREEAVAALRALCAGVDPGAASPEAILRELSALVLRAAFALHAEARGLAAGPPGFGDTVVALERGPGDARRAIAAWLARVGVAEGIPVAIDAGAAARALRRIAAAVGDP